MATAAAPRVEVTAVGLAAADSIAWRHDGRLRVTVIVKATFALVPGGAMTQVEPEPIVRAEVHHNNNPMRTVRLTSDLAPFLWRADVVLTGHARAPAGAPVEAMSVRLAVLREGPLLDKTIQVRGDQKGGATVPFERVPLVYERAYGGLGFADNPFGVGAGGSGSPNLSDPADPRRVACFAPMARAWPARERLLGREERKALGGPVAEIPARLDWSYFQAAPLDQRIDYLRGDERVVLEGFHPSEPRVQSRLPGASAAAVAYGLPGGAQVLALVADTLRIDADAMRCSVTWRGGFPIAGEATGGAVQVIAGVGTTGRPIAWPTSLPALSSAPGGGPDDVEDVTDLAHSVHGVPGDEPVGAPSAPAAARDLGATAISAPAAARDLGATATLDPRGAPATRALPFLRGAAAAPGPPAQRDAQPRIVGGTLEIEDAPDAPPSMPFWRPPPAAVPAPPTPPIAEPAAATVEAPAAPAAPAARRHPVSAEGIELVNGTPLALGVAPWGLSPSRDCLTVFAKATCDLVPGGAAAVRPAAAPVEPAVEPADRALFKVRADVVLVGHACAPAGPVRAMEVRFAFGAGANAFARRLRVSGDRRWEPGGAAPKPSLAEPFVRMPLGWERAFGGPRFEANPVGLGHADAMRRARREPVPLPNLEDPERPLRLPSQAPPPACFAPVPLAWKDRPARRAARHLPEDFDWTRFQIAPDAQRLAFLRGDEPFEIAGCHGRHEVLEGTLPGLRARCFSMRGGRFEEVPLYLDTVVFDVDAMTLELVWRGVVPVADERAPDVAGLYLLTEETGAETSLAEARAKLLPR